MTIKQLVAESNRIEGITRPPLQKEIDEFGRFLALDEITVSDLEQFVRIHQPGAALRDKPGMDVYVGNHHPPKGGPGVRVQLEDALRIIGWNKNQGRAAYQAHISYEHLHPFIDCNGRSGRILWYWMMREQPIAQELGFLHTWYYQSLQEKANA